MKEKIKQTLSGFHVRDIMYPLISFFFLIVLIIIFSIAVKSLYAQIDSALSLDAGEEPSLLRLDTENLTIIANKLSIPIRTAGEVAPEQTAGKTEETENTPTKNDTEETTMTKPDRASLRIAVYNSSGIAGVAGKLRSALESENFIVAEVGNTTPARETTVVQTEASLDPSLVSAINAIVSKSYTVTAETLPSNSAFDAIIIIGTK